MKRTVLKTLAEVKDWFCFPYPIIAFDVETTSLDYLTLDLVGISFCSGENNVCYIDLTDNDEFMDIIAFIGGLFIDEFKILIAHNISYDLKVLGKYGVCPARDCKLFCTQTAAHLLDENSPKSLKFLVKKYYDIDMKSWQDVQALGFHSQGFYNYGMDDALYTYKLHRIQHPSLKLEGLDELFFNIEMPFIKVKVDLEVNGVLIDGNKLNQLQVELKQLLYDLRINMCQAANIGYAVNTNLLGDNELVIDLNFNSSLQLVKLITEKLGLIITEKTKSGALSVAKDSLKKLKGQHPFIDLLRTYNKAVSLYDSYVLPFPDFIDSDGRIRCSWHNTVAITGRVTASKPGLAKLPRKSDEIEVPFEFRSCFIAPEGKKIVVCDYAGQELCWLGEVTQDQNLIDAIKAGKDLHLTTANIIFKLNIPDECLYVENPDYVEFRKKYKQQRYIGKNGVNFPLIYGKTAYGIAKEFNISEKEAQSWLDGFFSLYPDVRKSIAACHKQIDETGEVTDWFGRKRRLDRSDKYRAYRQGFNFLIQSPSASQMKKVSTGIKDLFDNWNIPYEPINETGKWDAKIILMIYDELVYEIDERCAEVSTDFVRDIMEDCIKTTVPFTVDTGVGQDYASAKM